MSRTEYNRNYMRKRRIKFKELGICPVCGKRKIENFACCEQCRMKQKTRQMKIKEILENARR